MKKLTCFLFLLVGCILCNSQLSFYYASNGLKLWFEQMIPALLPFMILSGIMVRMKLTGKIAMIIYPLIGPVYQVNKNVCYCMLMGFLCGFPMGAKVVADLYSRNQLSCREAEYLLAFCNNIGPVYFCSVALPLLQITQVVPCLVGMYGIPLLYGLVLRYTSYRDATAQLCCELKASAGRQTTKEKAPRGKASETPFAVLDDSIQSSLQSMLMLGGYMVLFNLLNLLPHLLFGKRNLLLAPILEITGGLQVLQDSLPLYGLIALSFGGLSCLAQTYSCISKTDLSMESYIKHKAILTGIVTLYYLVLSRVL